MQAALKQDEEFEEIRARQAWPGIGLRGIQVFIELFSEIRDGSIQGGIQFVHVISRFRDCGKGAVKEDLRHLAEVAGLSVDKRGIDRLGTKNTALDFARSCANRPDGVSGSQKDDGRYRKSMGSGFILDG